MILKDLIYAKGVLINEKYLASRLGIDIKTSTDWDKVKAFLLMQNIRVYFLMAGRDGGCIKLIIYLKNYQTYLSYLDAKEKVHLFKRKLKDVKNLNYPEPIETKRWKN